MGADIRPLVRPSQQRPKAQCGMVPGNLPIMSTNMTPQSSLHVATCQPNRPHSWIRQYFWYCNMQAQWQNFGAGLKGSKTDSGPAPPTARDRSAAHLISQQLCAHIVIERIVNTARTSNTTLSVQTSWVGSGVARSSMICYSGTDHNPRVII